MARHKALETQRRMPSTESLVECPPRSMSVDRAKRHHSDDSDEETCPPSKLRPSPKSWTAPSNPPANGTPQKNPATSEDSALLDEAAGWTVEGEARKLKSKERLEKKAAGSSLPNPRPPAQTAASRRPMTLAPRPAHTPATMAFKVLPVQHLTAYEIVESLQEDSNLRFSARPGRDCFLIHPKDQDTLTALSQVTSVKGKPVQLKLLDPGKKVFKGVVMGYPLGLPLDLLKKVTNISSATRCTFSATRRETKQVLIEHEGPLPGKLDLGIWGVFYVRPYSPEPIRCYRCHAFGHSIAHCKNPPKCGICSNDHETNECLMKYKAKQEITTKCPNCQGHHHAWNKSCPERRRRVEIAIAGQAQWVQTHCDAPAGTFVWGSQRKSPVAPAPPATTKEFPPLNTSPQHQPSAVPTPMPIYQTSNQAVAPPPNPKTQ